MDGGLSAPSFILMCKSNEMLNTVKQYKSLLLVQCVLITYLSWNRKIVLQFLPL